MSDTQEIVPQYEYDALLLELKRPFESNETDFKTLKFLLRERIPDGKRERLKTPLDVFVHLERLRLLGPDNLSGLLQLFRLMEKSELCDRVNSFVMNGRTNEVV